MTRHNSFKSRTTGFALTTHLYPKNSPFKFLDFVPNEAGDLSLVGGICTPVDKDCWSILHVVCDIEILFTVPGGKVYDPDLQAIAEALKTLGIPYDNKIGEILPKYNGSNCFSDCWQRNISNLKRWWLRSHGDKTNPTPDLVRDTVKAIAPWFDIDDGRTEVEISSRAHGNVGEEQAGAKDIEDIEDLLKEIKA
jgi:hypothetical protein